jgi:hypothetical protein
VVSPYLSHRMFWYSPLCHCIVHRLYIIVSLPFSQPCHLHESSRMVQLLGTCGFIEAVIEIINIWLILEPTGVVSHGIHEKRIH